MLEKKFKEIREELDKFKDILYKANTYNIDDDSLHIGISGCSTFNDIRHYIPGNTLYLMVHEFSQKDTNSIIEELRAFHEIINPNNKNAPIGLNRRVNL